MSGNTDKVCYIYNKVCLVILMAKCRFLLLCMCHQCYQTKVFLVTQMHQACKKVLISIFCASKKTKYQSTASRPCRLRFRITNYLTWFPKISYCHSWSKKSIIKTIIWWEYRFMNVRFFSKDYFTKLCAGRNVSQIAWQTARNVSQGQWGDIFFHG